jgi:hypothetical protein
MSYNFDDDDDNFQPAINFQNWDDPDCYSDTQEGESSMLMEFVNMVSAFIAAFLPQPIPPRSQTPLYPGWYQYRTRPNPNRR